MSGARENEYSNTAAPAKDPANAPSFALYPNNEGTVIPRNAVDVELAVCPGHASAAGVTCVMRMRAE